MLTTPPLWGWGWPAPCATDFQEPGKCFSHLFVQPISPCQENYNPPPQPLTLPPPPRNPSSAVHPLSLQMGLRAMRDNIHTHFCIIWSSWVLGLGVRKRICAQAQLWNRTCSITRLKEHAPCHRKTFITTALVFEALCVLTQLMYCRICLPSNTARCMGWAL